MKCGGGQVYYTTAKDGDTAYLANLFEGQKAVHIKLRAPPLLQHLQCTNQIFRHYLVNWSLVTKALSASIGWSLIISFPSAIGIGYLISVLQLVLASFFQSYIIDLMLLGQHLYWGSADFLLFFNFPYGYVTKIPQNPDYSDCTGGRWDIKIE